MKAYCIGLSNDSGFFDLNMADMRVGGSTHALGDALDFKHEPMQVAYKQGCVAFTLDQLMALQTVPIPNHIKIDVDGIEPKIVAGAVQLLRNPALRSLLIETNLNLDDHRAMVDQLTMLGFKVIGSGSARDACRWTIQGSCRTCFPTLNLPWPTTWRTHRSVFFRIRIFMWRMCSLRSSMPRSERNIPNPSAMISIEQARPVKGYKERFVLDIAGEQTQTLPATQKTFWKDFSGGLLSGRFRNLMMQIFGPFLQQRFKGVQGLSFYDEALLVEDITKYALGPHTDSPRKVLTFLFYLPKDDLAVAPRHFDLHCTRRHIHLSRRPALSVR